MLSAHALVPVPRRPRRPLGLRSQTGLDPFYSYATFQDEYRELSGASSPVIETTGMVTSDDVDTAINNLDPKMNTLNAAITACSAVPQSALLAWQDAFSAWQQVKSDWQFDKQGSVIPGPIYGPGILDRVQTAMNAYNTAQGAVAAACPSSAPPPTPGTVWNSPNAGGPGASNIGWWCQNFGIGCPAGFTPPSPSTSWADAVKWLAIASIVVVGIVYVWPTVAALVAANKLAKVL